MAASQSRKAVLAPEKLADWLRKTSMPDAHELADVLHACSKRRRCRSAACSTCGLAFQSAAVDVVETYIATPARAVRGRMHATAIVPDLGCVPPTKLTTATFRKVGRIVSTTLDALNLPPAIVGLEASFNEDLTGAVAEHWSVHAHLIGIDWLSPTAKRCLREAYAASEVARPTLVQELDDSLRGRCYPFKAERFRRVTQWSDGKDGRNRHRTTKHRSLRPWQAAQLALVEHQVGFHRRLLTHRVGDQAVRQHLECMGWPRDGP